MILYLIWEAWKTRSLVLLIRWCHMVQAHSLWALVGTASLPSHVHCVSWTGTCKDLRTPLHPPLSQADLYYSGYRWKRYTLTGKIPTPNSQIVDALFHCLSSKMTGDQLSMLVPLLSICPFQTLLQILHISWWVSSHLSSGISLQKHDYFWSSLAKGACINNYTIIGCFIVFIHLHSICRGLMLVLTKNQQIILKYLLISCTNITIKVILLKMCFWIYSCHYIELSLNIYI